MAYKILIAGETGNHCLEMAYYEAFLSLGHEVAIFDTKKAVQRYVKPHKWAYQVHRFFPVEAWIKKANKDFVNMARSFKPDVIIAFTGAEILPGTFAYLKTVLPSKIVWYWADPLPNLSRYIHQSLPLTDLLISYSKSSLDVFQKMGAVRTAWLPFAGDLSAHHVQASEQKEYLWDISFIGSWRPERENALKVIHENMPFLRLRINGPYWNRCEYKPLRKVISAKPLYGKAFSDIVRQSFLNLNVMDDMNYPSVNMRFFEILAAGGTEICSAAPEMEDVFIDRKQILYFSNEAQLIDQIQFAIDNKDEIERIKIEGQRNLMAAHLYRHRAESVLQLL